MPLLDPSEFARVAAGLVEQAVCEERAERWVHPGIGLASRAGEDCAALLARVAAVGGDAAVEAVPVPADPGDVAVEAVVLVWVPVGAGTGGG